VYRIFQKTQIYPKKRPVRPIKDISKKPLRIENTAGCAKYVKRDVYIRKRDQYVPKETYPRERYVRNTLSCAEHVKRDLNIRGKYRCRLAEETHTYRNHDEVCYVCQKRRVYTKKRPAPWKRDASKRPVYIGNTTRFTNSVKRNI